MIGNSILFKIGRVNDVLVCMYTGYRFMDAFVTLIFDALSLHNFLDMVGPLYYHRITVTSQ